MRGFRLFRIAGFDVKIDVSWFFIAALLVWSLNAGVFPASMPGLSAATYTGMAVVAALAFFAGVILHELAHSLVARAYGLEMGGITLFVFGGVAELPQEPQSAVSEFWIAVAGPAASLVLAAGCWLVASGLPGLPVEAPTRAVLDYLAQVNLAVALFNLVPAFPLDGGRVLRSLVWRATGDGVRATVIAARAGTAFAWLLMAAGGWMLLAGGDAGGLWFVLIGMFLLSAAQSSLAQTVLRDRLTGRRVSEMMTPDPVTTSPETTLADLADRVMRAQGLSFLPVTEGGRHVGTISASALRAVPVEDWPRVNVSAVMDPAGSGSEIDPRASAFDAVTQMGQSGRRKLVVVTEGRPVGVLTLADLLSYVQTLQEMGWPSAGQRRRQPA